MSKDRWRVAVNECLPRGVIMTLISKSQKSYIHPYSGVNTHNIMQHCSTDVCYVSERRVLVIHFNMFYVLIWADQRSLVPHGVAWDRITTQHIFGSGWAFGGEHSALNMSFLLFSVTCFVLKLAFLHDNKRLCVWIGHGDWRTVSPHVTRTTDNKVRSLLSSLHIYSKLKHLF